MIEKYPYSRFYAFHSYWQDQLLLEQQMAKLPERWKHTKFEQQLMAVSALIAVRQTSDLLASQMHAAAANFSNNVREVLALTAPAIEAMQALGGMVFSEAFQLQCDVSDWVFDLLYYGRLEHSKHFWWLGYWPGRAFEQLVLSMPEEWFERYLKWRDK